MGQTTYPTRAERVLPNSPYQSDAKGDIIPLTCDCGNCHLPFAKIEDGGLWVQTVHNGEKHKSRVPDAIILQLAGLILLKQMTGG